MPSKSKAKGNRFEYEVVSKLQEMGYKDVRRAYGSNGLSLPDCAEDVDVLIGGDKPIKIDRKSTRLNSSHGYISYAVFCLKKTK